MNQLEDLKQTFIEEYESALVLFNLEKIKSATILLSKAIFALCDYLILKKYSKLPKNHSERFRILELKEPLIYSEVDLIWSKYRDTYSKKTQSDSYNFLLRSIEKLLDNETNFKEIKTLLKK